MKTTKRSGAIAAAIAVLSIAIVALAYPPAVGILGQSENCLKCHAENGKWVEGPGLVIDIVDQPTQMSLRQADSTFLLAVKRGERVTVSTIIGYRAAQEPMPPYRNAWLYVDSTQIGTSSLTKFPTGWEVNLPMACRLVGDKYDKYSDANVTVLPMTVMPGKDAVDGTVQLQVMLTGGEPLKGKPKEGMTGNYHVRTVRLKVLD